MAVPETTGVKNAGGITRFMRETKVELKKVTWPTKQELIANTAVVLIAVVICAALIWVIDSFFNVPNQCCTNNNRNQNHCSIDLGH